MIERKDTSFLQKPPIAYRNLNHTGEFKISFLKELYTKINGKTKNYFQSIPVALKGYHNDDTID